MQLTKDDVVTFVNDKGEKVSVIDFSKFQQVVEFYEKYKGNPMLFCKECDIYFMENTHEWYKLKQSIGNDEFDDWLFSYCFKDGLK
jgi:hypothetical protein